MNEEKPILLFYPEPLLFTRPSRLSRICKQFKIPFHSNPGEAYDIHIFWSYTPNWIIPDSFTLNSPNVINRGCWNVGKQKVNDIFNDISVDPETHSGECIEKCDKQGAHQQHSLIKCPAPRREGFIYQRYIENKEDNLFLNYRILYADGVNYIVKQYKRKLFGIAVQGDYVKNEIIPVRSILTEEWQRYIEQKCVEFGFDYGDIDFLMDGDRPVVIDLNNVAGDPWYTPEIKATQDKHFIEFILKRFNDKTGKVCSER